jgi:inner membrane protein
VPSSASTRQFLTDDGPPAFVYRKGHYGVSLLAFAPLGYWLRRHGAPWLALGSLALLLGLAMLPDVDHRVPVVEHRGPTHTLAFALLVGAACGGLAGVVDVSLFDAGPVGIAYAAGLGALSVVAHLLADALTPAGVRPFWPISSRRVSIGVARAGDPLANGALFGLGVAAALLALWPG